MAQRQLMTRNDLLQKVVQILLEMLDFTLLDIVDENGETLPIDKWPSRALISINDITMKSKSAATEARPYDKTIVSRVKFPSKLAVVNTMLKFGEYLREDKDKEFIDVAKLPKELREAIYAAVKIEEKNLELMPEQNEAIETYSKNVEFE